MHDSVQLQKQTADNYATTNHRDQQKRTVVVVAIATATAAAITTMQRCDDYATATVIDGVMAMQR